MQNTLAAEPVHAGVETFAPDFERLPPQQYVLQRFLLENQNHRYSAGTGVGTVGVGVG